MTEQEIYMQRALQLASLGLGLVQPNPLVGAVLVVDNQIIGEGWHQCYGKNHAEINAILSVQDQELLKKATLYVNLEPCSHFGKTPPCANAIIEYQIPKVVIGNVDPHDKVNGKGIHILQEADVEVTTGVLEKECYELNLRFFTFHQQKRPYIILKWAQTADGFMDIDRTHHPESQHYWITNQEINTIVHQWRSEEDAILIGYQTYLNDAPQLTTRFFPGKNPKKFVLCHSPLRNEKELVDKGFTLLDFDFSSENSLSAILEELYARNIQSIIVEGGKKTLESFISSGLWDEARILTGNQSWGQGLPAPTFNVTDSKPIIIADNTIQYVRRHL
ncbi:MAG: bifunctional diaminohydroxyphosphoribosylaminopyrimidine deaminase/5-amino-6-(5-phosphoribosylamino)uracil reductase RibD [Bacteroidales bacterium]|jgi:diaminohydroxyphosphoribosylaminopyrimidine deaminase/5-amino-6-(5-phosphoribosylamino)uracil reductase|nr:bifunctional diaminohydroxyphosphoribosylaminopyrimidine deaminase/5-amino-6-(5-phosphoribosylamino)uracil reductase RibD [Bacteroidales bacterium]